MQTCAIDVFVPVHSKGLMVDVAVLKQALGAEKVRTIEVPTKYYFTPGAARGTDPTVEPAADLAVFVERVFEHEHLLRYRRRALLPNPEWLTNRDVEAAHNIITECWHKSRFSVGQLTSIFPQCDHRFIGFTSPAVPSDIASYESLAHFAGKSKTRHTQDIVDIWLQHEDFPPLALQAYAGDISIPHWVQFRNLNFFLGYMEPEAFQSEFAKHGVHICTSQMEGFGHYINEARAIGALVLTLDAPPMNELIDEHSGLLIPAQPTAMHNRGVRFVAEPAAIRRGILRALEMPLETRRQMGHRAKVRYSEERSEFVRQLQGVVQDEELRL